MSSRTFNPVVGNSRPCMMSVAIQKVQSSTKVKKRFAWILFRKHRISLIIRYHNGEMKQRAKELYLYTSI